MGTKLKRFNDNMAVRVSAFILCIAFFITTLICFGFFVNSFNPDVAKAIIESKDYEDSALSSDFINDMNSVLELFTIYKSDDYIKEGNTLSNGNLENEISQFYYNNEFTNPVTGETIYTNSNWYAYQAQVLPKYQDTSYENNPLIASKFKEINKEEINKIKNTLIQLSLNQFHDNKQHLDSIVGLRYYITDKKNVITSGNSSVKDFKAEFKKQPAYLLYENNKLATKPDFDQSSYGKSNYIAYRLSGCGVDNLTLYMSYDKAYLEKGEAEFNNSKDALMKIFPVLCASGILTLLFFGYLLITTGRKDEEGSRKLYPTDKIFVEIQLFITLMCLGFGITTTIEYVNAHLNEGIEGINESFAYYGSPYLYLISSALLAIIGLWFMLSVVRNLKARCFLKHSIIFRAGKSIFLWINSIWDSIKSIYYGSSIMKKVVLIALGICVLSATLFLAPVIFIVILIFAPKWVKKYEAIKEGVKEVKKGNLQYKIPVNGNGELDSLASDINDISEASKIAIQNELKNQRLKTDLISNVSHDLKTPLTSIITYIDLLKQEGLGCEDAPKYLDILDQKSERLKNLTEDLFEAAKASSGDIPVRFESVELIALLNQGLGELADKIETVGLNVKINSEQERYYVNADRQLLWRVIENLLGNVIKYAQEGSRVYIDLKEENDTVATSVDFDSVLNQNIVLEIKNISKTELNINADELMERFKRGDESRATEGSGLGLAIAKDLLRLQNGRFEIKIDGDLFKAIVMLKSSNSKEIKVEE